MATLKDTVINDTGFLNLPVGTTAQRPTNPVAGMWRYNSTDGAEEYYTGTAWKQIVKPDGTSAAKAATNATQLLSYQTTSGYYWIKPPNAPSAFYVYCDQVNNGGGWMLMMNITGSTSTHSRQTTAATTTVNSQTTVEFNSTSAYRWATSDINYFLQQAGNKVMWIEAKRSNGATTDNNPRSWFLRPGTQASPVWPNDLECSLYSTLSASATTSWLWQGYGSFADARDNVNMAQGNYDGGGHWAPTVYPVGQSFFDGGTPGGMRMNNPWNSQSPYTNGNSGYLWLKVY